MNYYTGWLQNDDVTSYSADPNNPSALKRIVYANLDSRARFKTQNFNR